MGSRPLLRLAAALVLGPFLSGLVLTRGLVVLTELRTLVFPFLWLYLFIEGRLARRPLSDVQVFLLGGVFAFLYEGLFTKRMQDGLSASGLDWVAILGGPLEWGMTAVICFHCLAALSPRRPRQEGEAFSFWGTAGLAAITAAAGLVYLWKTSFGFYRVEHFLGPMWLIDDLLLAGAAFWVWRVFRKSLPQTAFQLPAWVWGVVGLGLWLLGLGLLADLCGGLPAPKVLTYMVETVWLTGLGIFLWVTWRDRFLFSDEPKRLCRPVLAAAALRMGGTLALLFLFGSSADPRMAFWSGLLCDWPSKMLFFYAFLTSRLEV